MPEEVEELLAGRATEFIREGVAEEALAAERESDTALPPPERGIPFKLREGVTDPERPVVDRLLEGTAFPTVLEAPPETDAPPLRTASPAPWPRTAEPPFV